MTNNDRLNFIKLVGYNDAQNGSYIKEYQNVFVKIRPLSDKYDVFVQSSFSDKDYWVFIGTLTFDMVMYFDALLPAKDYCIKRDVFWELCDQE